MREDRCMKSRRQLFNSSSSCDLWSREHIKPIYALWDASGEDWGLKSHRQLFNSSMLYDLWSCEHKVHLGTLGFFLLKLRWNEFNLQRKILIFTNVEDVKLLLASNDSPWNLDQGKRKTSFLVHPGMLKQKKTDF